MANKIQDTETISFDTLKRLIGSAQARHIWAQKQTAEIGILFDDKALEATIRLLNRKAVPQPADVRLAAPVLAAYFREAFPGAVEAARGFAARRLRLTAPGEKPGQMAVGAMVVKPENQTPKRRVVRLMNHEFTAEKREAVAAGFWYCPNHPTKEERVQPLTNFYISNGEPMHRCIKCLLASGRARNRNPAPKEVASAAKMEGLRKAREIILLATLIRKERGLAKSEAYRLARDQWEAQHVTDLPPVPEETERPYEDTAELTPEPELVTANSGEVHQ